MRWTVSFALIAASFFLDNDVANARRGFVLYGSGDTISHRADLDEALREQVAGELGLVDAAIGYRYEYFSLFFLDLLTFEGEYVLFEEETDRYVPLDDEALESLGTSADQLGKPFFYYVPTAWPLILLVGGFGAFSWYRRFNAMSW
ncbi:MAG: hypothetical protein MUE69_01630 [Myxococcota bacterium]|jgi:hypothetical protein|nr:hypothetical protein [Myxococcota bacterium]